MMMFVRLNPRKPSTFMWLTILLLLLSMLLSCCTTYRRCSRKFASLSQDTITLTVPVIVPKDSVTISYLTDTLKITDTIYSQSGRARIKVYRDTIKTYVECDCEDTIIQVPVKCPPVVKFTKEPWFHDLRFLPFLIVVLVVVYFLIVAVFKFIK
jgi:hypothetical protein